MLSLDQYLVNAFLDWPGKRIEIDREGEWLIVRTQDANAWFLLTEPIADGGNFFLVRREPLDDMSIQLPGWKRTEDATRFERFRRNLPPVTGGTS